MRGVRRGEDLPAAHVDNWQDLPAIAAYLGPLLAALTIRVLTAAPAHAGVSR